MLYNDNKLMDEQKRLRLEKAYQQARIRDSDGDGIPDCFDATPTISSYQYFELSKVDYDRVKNDPSVVQNCRKVDNDKYIYRYQSQDELNKVQETINKKIVTKLHR